MKNIKFRRTNSSKKVELSAFAILFSFAALLVPYLDRPYYLFL